MQKLTVMLALAAAAGCASSGGAKSGTVSDADFGRLQAGQTGPVDQARLFRDSALDEQARAKLRLQEGKNEEQLAKADREAAAAQANRAEAAQKAATESREPAALEQARVLKEQAAAMKRAADAHGAYAKKMMEARQTAVDAAAKQVSLADAKLELAKVQALQQASVPAASKYDLTKFQANLDKAQKDFDQALQKTRQQESQAQAAHQALQDADRQVQAQAVPLGAPPTGTGSGAGTYGTGAYGGTGTGAYGTTPPPATPPPPPASGGTATPIAR